MNPAELHPQRIPTKSWLCKVPPWNGKARSEDFLFGTRTSHNTFCDTCGISPFRRSRSAPECIDVNARCLSGLALEGIPIVPFDGVHWEEHMSERKIEP